MEVFNLAKKGRSEKVFSFDEVVGCKFAASNYSKRFFLPTYTILILRIIIINVIDVGYGDLTYNPKRNLLGAISLNRKIAYHLFTVDTNCANIKESVKLIRKSKWHPQYHN